MGDGSKEQFRTAYRSGDVETMVSLLKGMAPRQRQELVDRLLFQRAHRPAEVAVQVTLLERLQHLPELPDHQRAYALIALGWTHLRLDDGAEADRCIPLLEAEIARLQADPDTPAVWPPQSRKQAQTSGVLLESAGTSAAALRRLGRAPSVE